MYKLENRYGDFVYVDGYTAVSANLQVLNWKQKLGKSGSELYCLSISVSFK